MQLWSVNSEGGYLTNNTLSKKMREQNVPRMVFRQFVSAREGGLHKGDTVKFNKRLRIDTQGGTLVETETIPANKILFMQGSVTIAEYGNGVQYHGKLQDLAEWDYKNELQQGLQQDMKDVLDSAVGAQFVTADFKAVCTATNSTVFTTDGTATATAANSPSDKNLRDIVDYMKKKQTPFYGGGDYFNAILGVTAMRGVYDYLEQKMQYVTPISEYNNEKGMYYGCRIVEDMNYLSNVIGSGTVLGEGVVFGDDAVVEMMALAEEIRAEVAKDAGRDRKINWYGLMGYAKMFDLSTDDLNSTGKGIERIVHITSA